MKTVLTKFLVIGSASLLMLASCKKEGTKVMATAGTPGDLTANTANLALDKTKYTDTATVVKFDFSKASFGFSAAVTNTLQIDAQGDNWANPTTFTLPAGVYSQGFNTAVFNSLLLKLNLPAGVASSVNVRVAHSISTSVPAVYSNTLSLSVTPFNLISYVWVPGTYQNSVSSKQWTPATADSLVSPTDNGVYTGYVFFDSGGNFKVTPANNWNSSYGDAGAGQISLTGGNLTSPGVGLYLVTVDLNKNTITYAPYVHTWSLIGDADVDWNTDFQMPFNQNDNAFEVTTNLKASGGFKFRADNQWSLSLGNEAPVTPQLTANSGANLGVAADGTYAVKLSFGNPLFAPGYTAVKQ